MARDAPARRRHEHAVRIVGRGRRAASRRLRGGRAQRTGRVVRAGADRPRDHRCARAAGRRFGVRAGARRTGSDSMPRPQPTLRASISTSLLAQPRARAVDPCAPHRRAGRCADARRDRTASGSTTDCRKASKKSSPPTATAISSSRSPARSMPTSSACPASRPCSTASAEPYQATLDGNEQYHDIGEVTELWRRIGEEPRLARLKSSILFIEQPIARDRALSAPVQALSRRSADRDRRVGRRRRRCFRAPARSAIAASRRNPARASIAR